MSLNTVLIEQFVYLYQEECKNYKQSDAEHLICSKVSFFSEKLVHKSKARLRSQMKQGINSIEFYVKNNKLTQAMVEQINDDKFLTEK